MSNDESLLVNTRQVDCDGGGGGIGHPKIYLSIGDNNIVECPYCGKTFIFKEE